MENLLAVRWLLVILQATTDYSKTAFPKGLDGLLTAMV